MARSRIGAAAATAEARIPDPPRCRTFRSQPELARLLRRRAEASPATRALELARQLHAAANLRFLTRRALLQRAAPAFFLASASPLLLQWTLISPFSSFCRTLLFRGISFSRFWAGGLACDAVSLLAKRSPPASPAMSGLALRPHPRQIS